MKLFTEIPVNFQSEKHIDYHSKIVGVGSCFVENIGKKLEHYKFNNLINPFGILFNPISIENFLFRSIQEIDYINDDIFQNNDLFHCYDAHSDLNSVSPTDILKNLNSALHHTLENLKTATHFIITLGTAWVYEKKADRKVVANCHKMPQQNFDKKLLEIDAIIACLLKIEF